MLSFSLSNVETEGYEHPDQGYLCIEYIKRHAEDNALSYHL